MSYFEDIRPIAQAIVAIVLLLTLLNGCASAPVVPVERHPPPADMIRLQPLPTQTDPTVGGLLKGYANAAQQYRGCVDRHAELQGWVESLK